MDYKLKGKRVRLIFMNDPYSKLESGDEGTIEFEDDIGQIHISWDHGSSLALIPGVDEFIILQ
jgi:hypothetical protein